MESVSNPGLFGLSLIALGTIHTFVGLVLGWTWVREVFGARAGFASVTLRYPGRMALLWFLWAGFAWMILGHHCYWLETRAGVPVPDTLVWALLAYATLGVYFQPKSGFPAMGAVLAAWLLFA